MIGALVQARMSSSRIPGKVLTPIAGRPLLALVIERVLATEGLERAAVATSDHESDDPIAEWCLRNGVEYVRGSLDDVATRMLSAAEALGFDAWVRVNADSPLIDPALIGRAVARYRQGDVDLVTNVYPARTCPKGQSVEVVSTRAYIGRVGEFDAEEREHVTLGLYRRPGDLRIASFACEPPTRDVTLTVDDPDDIAAFDELIDTLARPLDSYGWHELAELRRSAS